MELLYFIKTLLPSTLDTLHSANQCHFARGNKDEKLTGDYIHAKLQMVNVLLVLREKYYNFSWPFILKWRHEISLCF